MRIHAALLTFITVSFPVLASAQDAAIETTAAPFSMPDLASERGVGAELMFVQIDDGGFDDNSLTSAVMTLAGHFNLADGVVLDARLPLTYVEIGDTEEADLGNVSLGVRYSKPIGKLTAGGGARITVATAPEPSQDEDGLSALGATLSQFDRFHEFLPDTTTYSGQGNLRYDDGRAFVQGQIALNIHDMAFADESDTVKLVSLGVAAGIRATPKLAVVGELTTLSSILEESEEGVEDEEQFLHWTRVGARYQLGTVGLGAHLYVSLDAPVEDAIGGGLEAVASF